jgi:hypothetical protein
MLMVVVFLSLSMVELDDGGGFVGLLGRVCDFTAYFMWRLKFFFLLMLVSGSVCAHLD